MVSSDTDLLLSFWWFRSFFVLKKSINRPGLFQMLLLELSCPSEERSGCTNSAGPTFPPLPISMDQHKTKAVLVQAQHDPLGYFHGPFWEKTQVEEGFLDFPGFRELDSSLFQGWCGPAVLCRDVPLTPGEGLHLQLKDDPHLQCSAASASWQKSTAIVSGLTRSSILKNSFTASCLLSSEFLSAVSHLQLPGNGWKVLGVTYRAATMAETIHLLGDVTGERS